MLALSFAFSTQAMAKDPAAIDIFVGDFAAVGTADVQKLVANQMLNSMFEENSKSFDNAMNDLKAYDIDPKKDIDSVAFAITDKGKFCLIADANKSLTKIKTAIDGLKTSAPDKITIHNDVVIMKNSKTNWAMISDKRVLLCDNKIDIIPSIDNVKLNKPLKDRSSILASMYGQTVASADIRIGGRMTSSLRKDAEGIEFANADNTKLFKAVDYDAGALSISFTKGLEVTAVAQAKSDAIAADGAAILVATSSEILSDPSFKDMGLDFLASALKISSSKKNLKAVIKLTDEQLATIAALGTAMAADAQAPKAK